MLPITWTKLAQNSFAKNTNTEYDVSAFAITYLEDDPNNQVFKETYEHIKIVSNISFNVLGKWSSFLISNN